MSKCFFLQGFILHRNSLFPLEYDIKNLKLKLNNIKPLTINLQTEIKGKLITKIKLKTAITSIVES